MPEKEETRKQEKMRIKQKYKNIEYLCVPLFSFLFLHLKSFRCKSYLANLITVVIILRKENRTGTRQNKAIIITTLIR